MSRHLSDEMFDARVAAYLNERAEEGASRAHAPEQLGAEIARRLQPRYRIGRDTLPVLHLAWLIMVAALVLALVMMALAGGGRLLSVSPNHVVRIAIELPLGGSNPDAQAIANGIVLAVSDARGRAGRFQIEIPASAILSDIVGGLPDASQGAANMRTIVADPAVVAVIGPYSSFVAYGQIPISKAAGLLQCSPANTDPQLTQTGAGGAQPSGPPPTGGNYIRTITTDDIAAAGAARYLFERLGKTSVYVVDDYRQGNAAAMADWFGAEFTRLGGVVSRASMPDSGAALSAMLVSVGATEPQAIYFTGAPDRAATLLRAAQQAGLGDVPFVGTDALNDGSAATQGSFLSLVGTGAPHAYSVFPGLADGPGRAAFEVRYQARYGSRITPFAALGYACAQVVLAALQQIDRRRAVDTTNLRDAVRAAVVDSGATFETALGPMTFDARGDVMPKSVTIYSYDVSANDWVNSDQIEAAAGFGG